MTPEVVFAIVTITAGLSVTAVALSPLWRNRNRIVEENTGTMLYVCNRCGRKYGSWEREDAKKHDCVRRLAALIEYEKNDQESRLKEIEERQRVAASDRLALARRLGAVEAKIPKPLDAMEQHQYAVVEEQLRSLRARITGLENEVADLSEDADRRARQKKR